jgi:hypothetical protein
MVEPVRPGVVAGRLEDRADLTDRVGSSSYRLPPNVAVPRTGAMSPSSIRRVVVLPAPLGPSRAVTWPGCATALTSSTTSTSAKLLLMPLSSMVITPPQR